LLFVVTETAEEPTEEAEEIDPEDVPARVEETE
jgi:hypothetical protein